MNKESNMWSSYDENEVLLDEIELLPSSQENEFYDRRSFELDEDEDDENDENALYRALEVAQAHYHLNESLGVSEILNQSCKENDTPSTNRSPVFTKHRAGELERRALADLSCDEIRHRSLDVHFSGTEASLQELFDEVATTDVDYHEPLLSPRTDPEQSSLARSFGESGVENSRDESTLYYQEQNIDETPNFRYQRDIQPSYNHGAGRRVKVETIDSVENQSKHQQQCLAHESYSDGGTVLLEREIPVQGFKILDQIGSGTYGKVYKVVSTADETGQLYVLKQVPLDGLTQAEQNETINEAHFMIEIEDHENIVKHHSSFIESGCLNMIMEFCGNGDLSKRIKAHRELKTQFDENFIWQVLIQVCCALEHLHQHRILHRDIKPENIFLDAHDQVKVGDLGLGRLLSSQSKFAHSTVGTPLYFSPELCEEALYDERSDIWALGCLVYQMTALRPPFLASNQLALAKKIVNEQAKPIPSHFSKDLQFLVHKMLEKDPQKRPDTKQILDYGPVRIRVMQAKLDMRERQLSSLHTKRERELLDTVSLMEKKLDACKTEMREMRKSYEQLISQARRAEQVANERVCQLESEIHNLKQQQQPQPQIDPALLRNISSPVSAPAPKLGGASKSGVKATPKIARVHTKASAPQSRQKKTEGRKNLQTNQRQQLFPALTTPTSVVAVNQGSRTSTSMSNSPKTVKTSIHSNRHAERSAAASKTPFAGQHQRIGRTATRPTLSADPNKKRLRSRRSSSKSGTPSRQPNLNTAKARPADVPQRKLVMTPVAQNFSNVNKEAKHRSWTSSKALAAGTTIGARQNKGNSSAAAKSSALPANRSLLGPARRVPSSFQDLEDE